MAFSPAWADSEAIRENDAIIAARRFIPASSWPTDGVVGQRRCIKQPRSHSPRAERGHGADQEDGTEAGRTCDQAQRRRAETQGNIEEGGVGAHGEAAALWRRAAHSFNAEAGVNQRIP